MSPRPIYLQYDGYGHSSFLLLIIFVMSSRKNSNNSNKNEVIILKYRYITFWNTIFVVDEYCLNVLKTHVFFMNKNIILGITNKH